MRSLAALLFIPLIVSAQTPALDADPISLRGEELAARLRGSSFSFPSEGRGSATLDFKRDVAYRNRVNPIGKIIQDSGPWRVEDNAFCVTYPTEGEQCHRVRVVGGGLQVMRKGQWVEFSKQ